MQYKIVCWDISSALFFVFNPKYRTISIEIMSNMCCTSLICCWRALQSLRKNSEFIHLSLTSLYFRRSVTIVAELCFKNNEQCRNVVTSSYSTLISLFEKIRGCWWSCDETFHTFFRSGFATPTVHRRRLPPVPFPSGSQRPPSPLPVC